jgi:hypothetical protein
MYSQIILSIIIAILAVIILRGYDKFYNKQYTRKQYLNQFFLTLISSFTVLYIDNHFSNYKTAQSNFVSDKKNTIVQSGGTSSFKDFHQSVKPKSLIETNVEKIKMNFDTGIPNF